METSHLPGRSKRTYTSGCVIFNDRRAGTAAVSGAGNLKCKGWSENNKRDDENQWASQYDREKKSGPARGHCITIWAYFYHRCVGCVVSCGSRCRCAGCSRLGCILSEARSERKSHSSPQTLWWGYCAPQMAPYTEELQRNSKSGVWFRCHHF